MASFEEQYFDVLRAIEAAIVTTYATQTEARDRHADAALNGLTRFYNAALKERRPPRLKLSAPEQAFYDSVKGAVEAEMAAGNDGVGYSVEEIVTCLKRIHKSVGQMSKVDSGSGTRYLDFVRDYHKNREG